jgi:manganese/zinc/iron transport system permease protein
MLMLSGVIGGLSGWIGASLSALFSKLPAGAVIVLVSAGFFGVSLICGPAKGVFPRWLRHRRLSAKVGRQHLLRAVFEILEDTQESQMGPVRNYPVPLDEVVGHRSWSRSEVVRLVNKARRLGYIELPRPGQLGLSESGFGEASRVTRNHRLWEHFMIRFADIAPSHVDRDADMVEHVLGPEIVRQLEDELAQMEASTILPPSPHEVRSSQPQPQPQSGEPGSPTKSHSTDVEGPTA